MAGRSGTLTITVGPRRDKRKPFRFRVTGTLALPTGVTQADGCTGSLGIVGRKKHVRKPVFFRTATIGSACTFSVRGKLNHKAGRRGKVTFTVTFNGTAALDPATAKQRARFGR